jgi:hypothetical protein
MRYKPMERVNFVMIILTFLEVDAFQKVKYIFNIRIDY